MAHQRHVMEPSAAPSPTRSVRWAPRLLAAQIVVGGLQWALSIASAPQAILVATSYVFLALTLIVVFVGIQAAVATWRGKWMLVPVAAVGAWFAFGWLGFVCCSRWGS